MDSINKDSDDTDKDLLFATNQMGYAPYEELQSKEFKENINEFLETFSSHLNSICGIQHSRMTGKGFYDSFWWTRNLIKEEIDVITDRIDQWKRESCNKEKKAMLNQCEADYKRAMKNLREFTVNFILKQMCLVHEEASEGSSGVREGNRMDDKLKDRKAIEAELADIFIRGFDLAGFMGLDLGGAIVEKMGYNETRPYMHGKDA